MKARFLADNDLRPQIISATLRLEPSIDFRSARDAALDAVPDLAVLGLAAADRRILVTCDQATMRSHFAEFLRQGNSSPGVLLVIPQRARIAAVAETIELIWAASDPKEWANKVTKIPF